MRQPRDDYEIWKEVHRQHSSCFHIHPAIRIGGNIINDKVLVHLMLYRVIKAIIPLRSEFYDLFLDDFGHLLRRFETKITFISLLVS